MNDFLFDPDAIGAPPAIVIEHRRLLDIRRRIGTAATYTCVSFTQGYVPAKGTYIASMETAAIIYSNTPLFHDPMAFIDGKANLLRPGPEGKVFSIRI